MALQTLNNNRVIYEVSDAIRIINNFNGMIFKYDSVKNMIKLELYFCLRYRPTAETDTLLLNFINKFDNFFLKTAEVKIIIGYMSHESIKNISHKWFFRNMELGYVPTPVVLEDFIRIANDDETKSKIYELYPTKISPSSIFTDIFFLKTVFVTNDIKEIDKIFTKYKIVKTDIEGSIKSNALKFTSPSFDKNQNHKYVYNLMNYIIHNNYKLDLIDITNLLYSNMFIELITPLNDNEKYIIQNLNKIINKLNSENLTILLSNILMRTTYTKDLLNMVIEHITFDKYDESTISELIKQPAFSNLPFEYINKFYPGDFNRGIINVMFSNKHYNHIKEFIKILEEESMDKENLNNKNTTEETIKKSHNKQQNKIIITLQEIFELSFEYCSTVLIERFINNKYVITEEMVLKNFSKELFTILEFTSKKGVYLNEKCFDHLLLNMSMLGIAFNHKKIQNVSIYVNDDEEFVKFIPKLKEKYDYYNILKGSGFTELKTVVDFLKDKPVTIDMILLSTSPFIRAYLMERMNKEQYNLNTKISVIPNVKKIRKVIVKKIVKKSNNSIES